MAKAKAKATTKTAPAKTGTKRPTGRGRGRPSDYTPEKAALICEELAIGKSIREICAEYPERPDKSTIFRWLFRYPDFRDQYVQAKHLGMLAFAEEAIEIADDGTNDWMEKFGKDGENIGWQVNGEHIQRSKLRVDTRKWFMERLSPKVFGNKMDLNHGLQENNPIIGLMQQIAGNTLRPRADGSESTE